MDNSHSPSFVFLSVAVMLLLAGCAAPTVKQDATASGKVEAALVRPEIVTSPAAVDVTTSPAAKNNTTHTLPEAAPSRKRQAPPVIRDAELHLGSDDPLLIQIY